jgi:hypothetical protein
MLSHHDQRRFRLALDAPGPAVAGADASAMIRIFADVLDVRAQSSQRDIKLSNDFNGSLTRSDRTVERMSISSTVKKKKKRKEITAPFGFNFADRVRCARPDPLTRSAARRFESLYLL